MGQERTETQRLTKRGVLPEVSRLRHDDFPQGQRSEGSHLSGSRLEPERAPSAKSCLLRPWDAHVLERRSPRFKFRTPLSDVPGEKHRQLGGTGQMICFSSGAANRLKELDTYGSPQHVRSYE